ncbi:hypothetical protein PM3016_5478 [Paenibacillus mucilaginosus 3016]|uniref:Uncharacterized protein n=1 Tax=Paenibacillus mucilaginosus 3016 TaxID=1116391 RepID=H6NG51_9BACL|nr:hypothetical protein [Paenibacillus mucilaginosus]AFC32178.1 hypothetical protein PM3016_5478 [Paenibacillus mucilaginosus 3016]WFA20673.1 hypothetical protein ERY13_27245 [Paenibacillus mucilaginosus]
MAQNQPTIYEHKVMELLGNLAEMLLKKEQPREPFADYPDLLSANDIIEMTRWSTSHTYSVMNRPDFPLANGGEKPYCVLKVDFINWLKREVP